MTIGDRIKRLRESRGMSQVDLAAALGVSNKTVSSWESEMGAKIPRMGVVQKISEMFGVSMLEIIDGTPTPIHRPTTFSPVRVVGAVRAGYGGLAYEDFAGYEYADIPDPDEFFYLRVEGDSMSPMINDGDMALVRIQHDVESGQLAVVVIDGEEGTIKKVIKHDESIVLQPFNHAYPPRIFTGDDLEEVRIAGLVVETKRKW